MKVLDILKKAGYKFNARRWPTIDREAVKALGISVTDLEREFRPATLAHTMGPLYCIGFFLKCGNATRALAIRK